MLLPGLEAYIAAAQARLKLRLQAEVQQSLQDRVPLLSQPLQPVLRDCTPPLTAPVPEQVPCLNADSQTQPVQSVLRDCTPPLTAPAPEHVPCLNAGSQTQPVQSVLRDCTPPQPAPRNAHVPAQLVLSAIPNAGPTRDVLREIVRLLNQPQGMRLRNLARPRTPARFRPCRRRTQM
jgi:hypothetical protein